MGDRRKVLSFVLPLLVLFILLGGFVKGASALTTEEEKKLGKTVFLEIEKKMELVKEQPVQAFLNKIGGSLVDQVGPTPFEFRFYPVKAQDPNAFAIPGGYIFVTTGLIVLAESEQEVAGVLSHEIAHVTGRHVAQMIERAKRLSIATLAAMIAGAILGGGGKGSEAIAMTAMATSEAFLLKYTRENETEADQNSLHTILKAGYDPNGLISFLKKIQKYSLAYAPKIPAYLSTHPAVENRISLLENLLQMEPKPSGPFKETGNFRRTQVRAFIEEREPDMAVSYFDSMVKANPQDIDAIFGLGVAFRKMGRLDKSTGVFQTAHSFNPKEPEILRELGIVYLLSGKVDQAIETLEEGRSLSLSVKGQDIDSESLYYLGRAYQERGNFDQALSIFLKVQKEVPDFADVYYNLGSVYGRMGQKGRSHLSFGRHFKLKGEKEKALLHFGTALEWLEKDSLERGQAQREIRELKQKN